MLRKLEIIDRKLVESDAAGANVLLFIAPDEAELRHLCDDLRIDSHTLTSALDPEELGRVELEPDHLALIIKRPKQYQSEDNFFFKIGSVGIFLFADKLILIVAEDTLRFEGRQFLQVHSLQDVALKVIYRSIHHFREHLRVFSMIADELEQKINRAMENRQLLNLFTLEKSLVYYLNAISSNGRVIEKLKAYAPRINLSTENIEYLDDVMIENAQCHEMATTYCARAGEPGRRAGVGREQQPQRAHEDADARDDRHHAADAGDQHFFNERETAGRAGGRPCFVLGHHGTGRRLGGGRPIPLAIQAVVRSPRRGSLNETTAPTIQRPVSRGHRATAVRFDQHPR